MKVFVVISSLVLGCIAHPLFAQSVNLGAAPFADVLLESELALKPATVDEASLKTANITVRGNVKWVIGLNQVTLCLDIKNDIFLIKVENSEGRFTVEMKGVKQRLIQSGKDPNLLTKINLMEVLVANAHNKYGALLHFDAPELGGTPFDTKLEGRDLTQLRYHFGQFCSGSGNSVLEFKGTIEITNPLEDYHNNFGIENLISFKLGYDSGEFACPLITASTVEVPEAFEVRNAYPNPFQGQTHIEVVLPSSQLLHVEVYNVMGQAVRELKSDWMEAGTHRITFDASELAQGTYFIRVRSNEEVKTIKVQNIQ